MDPFMLHPVTLEMAVPPQGVSVMIAACVCGHCLGPVRCKPGNTK